MNSNSISSRKPGFWSFNQKSDTLKHWKFQCRRVLYLKGLCLAFGDIYFLKGCERLWFLHINALHISTLRSLFRLRFHSLNRDYLIDWLGGLDGLQGLYGLDGRLVEHWQIFGILHIVAGIFTASGRTCSSGWGFEALVISFMFCSLFRFVYNVLLCLCLMRFVSAVLTCRWPGADPSPEEQRRNPQVQKNIRSPFVQNYIIRSSFLWKYLIWSLFVQKYIIRPPLCQNYLEWDYLSWKEIQ